MYLLNVSPCFSLSYLYWLTVFIFPDLDLFAVIKETQFTEVTCETHNTAAWASLFNVMTIWCFQGFKCSRPGLLSFLRYQNSEDTWGKTQTPHWETNSEDKEYFLMCLWFHLLLPAAHHLCCSQCPWHQSQVSPVVHCGSPPRRNHGNTSTPFLSPSCKLLYILVSCTSDSWGWKRRLWNDIQVFVCFHSTWPPWPFHLDCF